MTKHRTSQRAKKDFTLTTIYSIIDCVKNGVFIVRKIIASIDIGSDSTKLVVGEFFDNRLHILSASKTETKGIERGKIVDENAVIASIKEAVDESSKMLGVTVEKCVLCLNMVGTRINKSASAIKIKDATKTISGSDVQNVISKCVDGKIPEDYALVSVLPVEFTIDGDVVTTHPVGQVSENLGLKALVVSSHKDYVSEMLDIVNKAGLKVLDVVPSAVCDYYALKNASTDVTYGVVVNLGAEIGTVSIFDQGMITEVSTFRNGGKNIVNDISFVCKIDESDAKAIYNDITLASSKLANPNEYRLVTNYDGEEVKLNQYDMSEIATSRIVDILNLVKKQINILTKSEISYIIVSGGLTELRDFNYVVDSEFGKRATIGKLNLIGARDNSYTSAVGAIKLYDERLETKGKALSIFSNEELEDMKLGDKETNTNNNSLLGKVFGYFFDN